MKVSLNDAKIWATPKTSSPSLVAGPRVTVSSFGSLVLLFDCKTKSSTIQQISNNRKLNTDHYFMNANRENNKFSNKIKRNSLKVQRSLFIELNCKHPLSRIRNYELYLILHHFKSI